MLGHAVQHEDREDVHKEGDEEEAPQQGDHGVQDRQQDDAQVRKQPHDPRESHQGNEPREPQDAPEQGARNFAGLDPRRCDVRQGQQNEHRVEQVPLPTCAEEERQPFANHTDQNLNREEYAKRNLHIGNPLIRSSAVHIHLEGLVSRISDKDRLQQDDATHNALEDLTVNKFVGPLLLCGCDSLEHSTPQCRQPHPLCCALDFGRIEEMGPIADSKLFVRSGQPERTAPQIVNRVLLLHAVVHLPSGGRRRLHIIL
mmetsp:Transcript_114005/g.329327  ORF Transcript_114005/g.329327 Transcript_114005/m.329327 type:complete len:257 (+) Transcript_114005:785-1555(+)